MRARKISIFWVKLAAFLCLLIMMFNAVELLLSGRTDTSRNATALKLLPRDSVDVLWVGSSHIFCGVIPQMLYDEHGIASAMLSMHGLTTHQMYWGLKETLRRQNPDVVVVDLYTATVPYSYGGLLNLLWMREPGSLHPKSYVRNLPAQAARWIPLESPNKAAATWDVWRQYDLQPAELLVLTKLHNRYDKIERTDFLATRAQSRCVLDFGVDYRCNTMTPDQLEVEDYTPEVAVEEGDRLLRFTEEQLSEVALQPEVRQDIERMIQLTRERGIELVFCVAPYIMNAAEEKIYQQLAELAREEGVPFVGIDEVPMEYEMMSDMGHMNADGAMRYTAFWGEELSRRFNLPDRRQSTDRRYAAWREHPGRYLSQIAARREYDTMSEYLEMLTTLDDDFLILLGFQGPVYERFTDDDYWLLVDELGIPEETLAQWYDTGEGTLNVLVHNKQTLASSYSLDTEENELRWDAFGNAVSIRGGVQMVNRKRSRNSDKDGLHVTVFSLSDNEHISRISFDLTQVVE